MKIIIGNQKAYLGLEDVNNFIKNTKGNKDTIICPSFPYITKYVEESKYTVGAQDVSVRDGGATTGEVSAKMLSSLGVTYCIVGHSERRAFFKETKEELSTKINKLNEFNITPIFCVGENRDEKDAGTTKDVVGKEVLDVFDMLDKETIEKIIIAYEPVWAISDGIHPARIPTNEEIIDVTNYIKDLVSDKYGVSIKVLYGGSVNSKNVDELNKIEVCDGYLIGGASVKAEEFNYIMERNL